MAMTMSQLEETLRLHIVALGLPEPAREYRFHPGRRWRFDFAWPGQKVACEVEGGIWANGRHNRAAGFAADCEKYNAAVVLGYRVLRVTGDQVDGGQAVDWIRQALAMETEAA